MLQKLRIFIWAAIAFFISLPSSVSADVMEDIIKSGKLRVGVSLFVPWTMKAGNEELVGFEIDVAKKLAEDMGVVPEFHVYKWEDIISGLLKKEIDVILGGMVITPERALKVNFSRPYAESGVTMATNTEMTKHIKSLRQLNNKKIVVSLVSGTVSSKVAESVFNKATIKEYKTSEEAKAAVLEDRAHVYLASAPQPEFLALEHSDKVDLPLPKPLRADVAGIAVNKGEQEWLNFLNSWVTARKADGWLSASHKYWFTSLDWKKGTSK